MPLGLRHLARSPGGQLSLRPSPNPGQAVVQYILVVQWPGASESDYQALIAMEDLLEGALPGGHGVVDGHDFGAGEMNIFIETDRPVEAFADVKVALARNPRWPDARAAYRRADGDDFVVLWPEGLERFAVQ